MQYLQLLIQFAYFLILTILCFFLPGILILEKSKVKLSFWERVILGTSIGLIFFSLLSYFLLLMNLHLSLLAVIFIIDIIAIKQVLTTKHQINLLPKTKLVLLLLVLTFGVFGQLLIIAPSGFLVNGNLLFWSSHGHDGTWHIALMNEYQKGFPLQNPILAGEKLVNYHFFSDIAPADFNHYFRLPSLDLYFRFFPFFYSMIFGGLAYLLGRKMGGSFQSGIWAMIFTYFAGSFGYLATYLKNHSIGGESIFWASQVQSSVGNPPQIVAFIIIITFLYLFSIYKDHKNFMLFFICSLLAGSLAEFKIYGAIVLLISLGLVGLWQVVRERKFHSLFLFFSSSIVSLLLYFPNSSNAGTFLIFQPWFFIRTMIVAPDRLNWLDLELKRQTYMSEGNWKRVIQIEIMGFLIFFFGNLGMRFLGLFSFPKFLKMMFSNYLYMITILMSFISLSLPFLFLQKGVATNTIQFMQYFLLILGIFAGVTISEFLIKIKSIPLATMVGLIILFLAVPTQFTLIKSFYNRLPFAKIENQEILALNFLKENTSQNSVILTAPYNKDLNLGTPIPQIWDWSDTAYVSALSDRRTFLSDTEQVDIMGYDLKKRLTIQQKIFTEEDPKIFIQEIKGQKINYLYFPKILKPKVDLPKTSLKPFFSNSLVEIWKVE